ncbi:hypothetical protein KC19_6G040100 [Ceratodon purpureus]|uniref:RING-type E3 ubiquitin transferase BRCA1 n=1 Tax=Ceratodon purpureus TaxID=3225 RepID=A0A8T0HE40_CERPU|nr:hypothetical protein KC19_6G040100 [Ceratodon purpureus]
MLDSALLKPSNGETLVLNNGVTWIGRGSFLASDKAHLLCSRRQACLNLTATRLVLECHGINPLVFVVCHARNFHGIEETPASELFQLQKGEAVELTDGDQFYYAAMECLLTVVIRMNSPSQIPGDALELALQQASNARVEEEQLDVEIGEELRCPAEDCGTSEPQNFLLTNDPVMCASSSQAVAASHCPGVDRPRESFVAFEPSGNPALNCPVLEKPRDGSVRAEQEDSDSLGLDAYDCAAPGVRPFRREEILFPVENDNSVGMYVSQQIRADNRTDEALARSTAHEVLGDGICPQSSINGEGCRPLNDIPDDLPCEAPSGQRETQDYNPIMSSETVDGRSIEDDLIPSEPARDVAFGDVGDCLGNILNLDLDHPDDDTLSRSPLSGIREGCLEKLQEKEHLEVSGRASEREDDPGMSAIEREDDPVMSADVEDESWPDGPVDGMEPVIASVSGYEGADKQNLVKLINKTGAGFTGVFSKANTHLVCWSFHGKKFDKAMKLHKVVVNHQWFEDCLRAGKRLSEDPYKLRSGEDVGPLKWKQPLPPPVTAQAEPSNGAANQYLGDRGASFWNTIDEEINMDQQGQVETSYRKYLPGPSRQAGVATVEAGHTGGRKSRRLIKRSGAEVHIDPLTVEQENLVRENPSPPASSSGRAGESYQRRTGEFVRDMEQGYYTRRRKSASAALHNPVQVQGHETKRRKSASSVLERGIDGQEQGAVRNSLDNLTGRGRPLSSVAPDREFTVVNLADDDVREVRLRVPQASSAQATEGTNAETTRDTSLQDLQPSQLDKEVACAICLVEAKSSSEGLLECGHKYCYKCIFTWTIQEGKGPGCPLCPLCKASFDFITRHEVSSSGKLDETVVVVGKKESGSSTRTQRTVVLDHVCIQCGNSDSESLLIRCGTCANRAIHNFCMDPPAPPPWFCPGCMHGHHRDSMRLAWNQFLPGPSTSAYGDSTQEIRPVTRPSNVRRRNTQPYALRRPSRPVSTYRPSLHTELTQNMGPVRRRNVVGQHSLRSWLSNDTSNGDL